MKVLVTGGHGFIGTAVRAELDRRGHTAKTFDRPSNVCNHGAVNSAAYGCDAVIHLAGLLGTHELFDQPSMAIDVNIHGTRNVLEAAVRWGLSYVGITMPDVFPSIYTATKIGAARLERAFHHTYDLPVSRVRAFNAYGPGQKYGLGHPQKIVPTFATLAWQHDPIPIWGDGNQTVDLVHVDDIARMLVDALAFGDDQTFDAGTGTPVSVNEVAEFACRLAGSKAGVEHLPMRRGEIPTTIVARGEGWKLLDWRPVFSWDRLAETMRSYQRVEVRAS